MYRDTVYDSSRRPVGRWLDVVGWVVFTAWVVLIFLFKPFPEGVGSLGVGTIVFSVAMARRLLGVSVSNFWIIIGGVFILAGGGHLLNIDFPFTSVALIATGILMLCHKWARKH